MFLLVDEHKEEDQLKLIFFIKRLSKIGTILEIGIFEMNEYMNSARGSRHVGSSRRHHRDDDTETKYHHIKGSMYRPSNSTTNRRKDSSSYHSRSPPPRNKDLINPPCCISPMAPSDWVLGPDHQSERAYTQGGQNDRSGNNDFLIGSARLPGNDVSLGLNFMDDNLHVIPISPMMVNSVDETWDFDFEQGRGGTTVNTTRSRSKKSESLFPDLSPPQ